MDKYHAYSAYKDVGPHWVSSIPEHWSFTRNIALFEERESKNHPQKELLAVTIAYGVVKQKELAELTERKNTASDDKTNYKLVKPGDLAYNKMRMWQGAIGISSYEGIVSPAYVILKAKATIDPRYFHYQFKTPGFISEAGRYSYGLCDDMNSLRFKDFKTLYSVHPPLKEQCAIADFLDHETAKIDHLIAKQERLIELLKEKRQAVISHAVTKGLDPDAPMKDSGVEWLGEVPAHWRLLKFGMCARIRNGQVDPKQSPFDEYMLIAPNHIESGTGRLLYTETASEQGADSGKYLCKEGEIIYSKIRPALSKACLAHYDKVLCSADMYPLEVSEDRLVTEYFLWFILSREFTTFAVLESDRVAMPKINRDSLSECRIPVPPISEQHEIVTFIKQQIHDIDRLSEKASKAIELMKEHRTALISAAVTGKIDVRDWQKPEQQSEQTAKTATG